MPRRRAHEWPPLEELLRRSARMHREQRLFRVCLRCAEVTIGDPGEWLPGDLYCGRLKVTLDSMHRAKLCGYFVAEGHKRIRRPTERAAAGSGR